MAAKLPDPRKDPRNKDRQQAWRDRNTAATLTEVRGVFVYAADLQEFKAASQIRAVKLNRRREREAKKEPKP